MQRLLTGTEQVALLRQQFHGVLHAEGELLVHQVVAHLRAAQLLAGGILLLGVVGIQPETLDGFVECLLLVQQSQGGALLLQLGLLHRAFGLPLCEDRDADRKAQRVVLVLLHLLAEGEVVAIGVAGADARRQVERGQVSGACNPHLQVGRLFV